MQNRYILRFLLLVLAITKAFTFPTIQGCPELLPEHFEKVVLVSNEKEKRLQEPLEVLPIQGKDNQLTILFTERSGQVKAYLPTRDTIQTVLDLRDTVSRQSEDGLVGIILDPSYQKNQWVYIYMVVKSEAGKTMWRLSRFTMDTSTYTLRKNSEAMILEFPAIQGDLVRDIIHTGGGMVFDSYGDLWIGTGDNNVRGKTENGERSSSCTSDLRGSILRIHPLPVAEGNRQLGVDTSYTVPKGNYAELFVSAPKDSIRRNIVRPEIYAKGVRNPYTITAHPTKRWVGWGDCGPDIHGIDTAGVASRETEEHNLATSPGFYGYPYFAGNNLALAPFQDKKDFRATPSNNNLLQCFDGRKDLTTPIPGTHSYGKITGPYICAITGPWYIYNPKTASKESMPPHFHNRWIVGDWGEQWFGMLTVGSSGQLVGTMEKLFSNVVWNAPLHMAIGPEGALYVVEYGSVNKSPVWFTSSNTTAISKVIYRGPEITKDCINKAMKYNE